MKYKPKTKPFPHQEKATLAAARARNYAIFMEPRLGKSKAALDYCGVFATRFKGLRVAILCPATAQDVWLDQIAEHYPGDYVVEDRDYILQQTPYRAASFTKFYLMSHELFRTRRRKSSGYNYPSVELIEEFDPDVVIDDESHRHKRAGGVGSQALWRSVRRMRQRRTSDTPSDELPMPWVLLLSGTPNPKGWIDVFSQFRIMDDTVFGTAKDGFEERYCVYGTGRNQYKIVKYLHEKEIQKKLKAHSISVSAEQAGLAGKLFFQNLYCSLPAKVRKHYEELATEYLTQLDSGAVVEASNPGVKRLRLLQIAGGFTTDGEQIHGEKLQVLAGYLGLLGEQEEPMVVYARHLAEVEACAGIAERCGLDVRTIVGDTSRADRARSIQRFQRGGLGALVLQTQAGSVAIELSRAAECIFYSCPDAWDIYKQNYDRLRGPKQKRPVRVTNLVCQGTVDRSVLRGLQTKEGWHDALYRDPRAYLLGL